MRCVWPPHDADGRLLLDFSDAVFSALEEQGYCTIDLLESPEAPEPAVARLSAHVEQVFQTPPPALASAYLGTDHSSEIASFDVDAIDDLFLSGYVSQLHAATHLLEPWMQQLGFEPDLPCSKMVFRRSRKRRSQGAEDDPASQGISAGKGIGISNFKELSQIKALEDFLQWVPRRF